MAESSSSLPASSSLSSSSSTPEPGSYTRGLHLRRFGAPLTRIGNVDGFRLYVQAYGAYLMPNEVFRFRRDAVGAVNFDRFDGVCSSADLADFPVTAPEAGAYPPFFRLDHFDVVLRAQHQIEAVWLAIQEEVATLVATLNLQDKLQLVEDAHYGMPPPATPGPVPPVS